MALQRCSIIKGFAAIDALLKQSGRKYSGADIQSDALTMFDSVALRNVAKSYAAIKRALLIADCQSSGLGII